MKIEQRTITTLVAEDGKLLVRKSDGHIFGNRVTLGYDYYDAGVALAEPRLLKPEDFEEIDKPADWEEKPVINQVARLKRTTQLIAQNVKEMNELHLSAADALEVKDWYPKWGEDEGFKEGDTIKAGTRFQFGDKLYEALQDHTIMSHYEPSIATASLYKEVTEDDDNIGTKDNPIAYNGNMALEEGKYYTQDGVVYLCTRDTINPVYNALKDLVGLYVEVA